MTYSGKWLRRTSPNQFIWSRLLMINLLMIIHWLFNSRLRCNWIIIKQKIKVQLNYCIKMSGMILDHHAHNLHLLITKWSSTNSNIEISSSNDPWHFKISQLVFNTFYPIYYNTQSNSSNLTHFITQPRTKTIKNHNFYKIPY